VNNSVQPHPGNPGRREAAWLVAPMALRGLQSRGQRQCDDRQARRPEMRETPAGVRAKPGSPARGRRVQSPAASLKPGRVNRAFRRQARISTDRKKPRPDRRWSGLQEGKPVQSTPTAQIGNSPHYPRRWSSGSLAMLAATRRAGALAAHAGICAGGAVRNGRPYRDHRLKEWREVRTKPDCSL
jgi:hypothetical protein